MATATEAPIEEPRTVSAAGTAVEIAGLGHRFGELEVLERVELEVAEREVVGLVGPSGCGKSTLLELIAGLLEPSAGAVRVGGHEPAAERLARCVYMPQRDLLLPWLSALDNAALAPRNRGASRAEARERGRAPVRALRPRRVRGRRGRPSSRAGCASGSPSCARCWRRSRCCCSTSRSPRSTRSRGPRCRSGWRARWRRSRRPSSSSPTTSRRRSTSATGSPCSARARRRTLVTLDSPRPRATPRLEAVTSPEFTAARERALEALAGGSREAERSEAEPRRR